MSDDEKLLKEAKKFPWDARLFHKNWKVRTDANIDLAALCGSISDPKNPRLREFGHFFKKTVADSNAMVQEKALDALIAFLKAADADIGRYAKEVCDAIAAKCLTGRPKTVEKAQMVFLLWVELEAVEAFLDSMEKAIKNKVAKAVVPAIDVMCQALSEFGAKVVPPKRILKMLPELFDHQDQNVRASSKGLTLELCRWIGKEPVKSILFEKMRDTMKKELESELVNVSGTAKPTRKIRSEQDNDPESGVVAEAAGTGSPEEYSSDAPQEIDEYELVDPVDILTPLEKSAFWDGVKATKWSERKQAVAELTKLASTKRIAPGDFTEICRTLKKLIADVNIAVSVEAIHAIGNLARGLRVHFAGSSRFLLPVLLEKLKEKKPTLADALTQTLQAIYMSGCLNLLDIVEDINRAVKNKVPLVRSLTLIWLTFCVETSKKSVIQKIHKHYVPICMECLNDGTPDVRDAAFSALTAIAKSVGMRPLEKSLEKLDDVRRKKLNDMIGSSGSGPPTVGGSGTVQTLSEGASEPGIKKGASAIPATNKKVDGGGQATLSKTVRPEDIEPSEMSLEEIEPRLGSLIQADTISQLKSTAWKERLEAISSLKEQVEHIQELDQSVEILIHLLCAVPGWSEKNVQVQQQTIEVILYIASNAMKFPKRCILLCLPGLSERVADIKTRVQAMKCLTTFSEAVGPGFIFEGLYKIMKEHKNPKVLSEGILWMVSAVEDFGVSHLKLKDLIDFCKEMGLQSSAAATRNATIKLIGVLHKFVGPDIKGFLSDVKPALLTALDAECEKNPYEGPSVAPKKTVKGFDSSSIPAGGSDSLPREDISEKITPSFLKNFESSDWKTRLESIEALNRILEEANQRIQPTGTVELFGALRGRLSDSNKKVAMEALCTIGSISSAMGQAVEKASKGIISDVLKCLGDNKKQMRECAVTTLDAWLAAVHLDKMVPYLVTVLSEPKLGAEGLKDLFEWLSRQLSGLNDFPDAVHLLKPTSAAMMGKSSGVRKAAEACLTEILRVCGPETVIKNLKSIQGPALAVVVEKLKPYGSLPDLHDSIQVAATATLSKPSTRVGKVGKNTPGVAKHGRGSISSRPGPTRGPRAESIMAVHDISVQSHDSTPVAAAATLSKSSTRIGKAGKNAPSVAKRGTGSMSLRSAPTRGPRAESIMAVHDISIQSQPLLNIKDSNKKDRERMVGRRFKFEEPRVEQIQDLEAGLAKYFREDLSRRLLSADFKKHVDGMEMLHRALPSIRKDIIEVMDFLLRWLVLRFCESNTKCLLKVLEFLPDLIEALKSEDYALTDAEAAIFLPCLVEKSGHNFEKLREKMRDLTKQIVSIYPAAKVFPYVVEGLRSKNNRTRIECADLVGHLFENHISEISGQLKSLQMVASLTAERDGEIRKAALNTLATGYKILGEDIWKYVGKLTDAQRSMIHEKFKTKAREMDRRREGKPGDARAALRSPVRDNGSDIAEQSGEVSTSITGPVFARENNTNPDVHMERNPFPRAHTGVTGPLDWNEALAVIANAAPEQSVEAIEVVRHELGQATNDPDGSTMNGIVIYADRLVSIMANQVAKTFDISLFGASSRSCRYVLDTLMQTFQSKTLAHAVKENTLDYLITELLLWLLDERVPRMDDGRELRNTLNALMLKILDNANQTSCFLVLINLLRPVDPSRWPSPASNEETLVRNQKFSDLVVICLIKLTKVLQSTINDLDLDRILQSIHLYMQELGMDEIRRRHEDGKPLRMVKTVLHELVKLRGTAIKGHLSMVPIDTEPQPIILGYIDLNIQALAEARMLTPTGPVGQTHRDDSAAINPYCAPNSADAQLKQELDAVFKKIGDKETCSIGLYELYRIKQLYPKVDIFGQLGNANEAFRTYIRDGLAQMEKNVAAGRTPSNVPLSTPPSASMTPFPPKMAPLSPAHTNSLNDGKSLNARVEPTNMTMPPSFSEGEKTVTTGTVAAIRQRLKSMEIAAGGAKSDPGILPLSPRNDNANYSQAKNGVDNTGSENPTPVHSRVVAMDEKALSGLKARMQRLKSGSLEHQ